MKRPVAGMAIHTEPCTLSHASRYWICGVVVAGSIDSGRTRPHLTKPET